MVTTRATKTSILVRAITGGRQWLLSRRHQAVTALVLYAAISIGYFGLHVVPHLGSACACEPGPADPSGYMWNLAWWPHALLHGLNPFHTTAVFAPDRVTLGGEGMLVPAAAILVMPITLLFGPLVAYNVLMLASPVLAAFFAFLLCRYASRSFAAGLVGGYLFGFSAYMLGHMLGHLNLVLVFPIPAAVYLTLRLIDRRISERRFVILMAFLLAILLASSTELAFTFVVLGALALMIGLALVPSKRPPILTTIKPLVLSGILAALVTSPIIYYGLKGVVQFPPTVGDLYGGDALGFLVPTTVSRFGRTYFAIVAARFTSGNVAESGLYIGLPLALIVAHFCFIRWHLATTKVLTAMLAVVVVLLLGLHLHIAGYQTIPLPWQLIDHSLMREVLPARLGLYMFLIVAMIAAMWLARPAEGRRGLARWAVAGIGIVLLVPNVASGLWRSQPPNPRLFSTQQYRTVLNRGETVLVLPYAEAGDNMLWQAETGMWFRMAGGYLGTLTPPDYATDPLMPALLGHAKPEPQTLRSFLTRRRVSAVIVDPASAQPWLGPLADLGLRPVSLGGLLLYRV